MDYNTYVDFLHMSDSVCVTASRMLGLKNKMELLKFNSQSMRFKLRSMFTKQDNQLEEQRKNAGCVILPERRASLYSLQYDDTTREELINGLKQLFPQVKILRLKGRIDYFSVEFKVPLSDIFFFAHQHLQPPAYTAADISSYLLGVEKRVEDLVKRTFAVEYPSISFLGQFITFDLYLSELAAGKDSDVLDGFELISGSGNYVSVIYNDHNKNLVTNKILNFFPGISIAEWKTLGMEHFLKDGQETQAFPLWAECLGTFKKLI